MSDQKLDQIYTWVIVINVVLCLCMVLAWVR